MSYDSLTSKPTRPLPLPHFNNAEACHTFISFMEIRSYNFWKDMPQKWYKRQFFLESERIHFARQSAKKLTFILSCAWGNPSSWFCVQVLPIGGWKDESFSTCRQPVENGHCNGKLQIGSIVNTYYLPKSSSQNGYLWIFQLRQIAIFIQ